jgi:hypothetical protein
MPSLVSKLRLIFSMTCLQATKAVSKAHDAAATPSERLALWLHLPLCKACRLYAAQLKLLRRAAQRLKLDDSSGHASPADASPAAHGPPMPGDVASRLKSQLS